MNIIVSVFGSTDTPTSSGADPVQLANTMAQWVIEFGVDGVDVDYEVRNNEGRYILFFEKRVLKACFLFC